jgi:hypothetical protein
MAIQTYNFPDHKRGTTFNGVQFELIINGVAKNLTGTVINMNIAGKVFSNTTGEIVFSDITNGKFQFKAQVINLSPKTHNYSIKFIFPDGKSKIYLKGNWKIYQ